ncbi:MAG: hypothetical protein AABX82_03735 [Nanoarchaeota archaeon]
MEFLIVEDNSFILRELKEEVMKIMKRNDPSFSVERCVSAQSYNDARRFIDGKSYEVILLDHRMPVENAVELEKDYLEYNKRLRNIGYSLIPMIRARERSTADISTAIIGTSSFSDAAIREDLGPQYGTQPLGIGLYEPNFKINKSGDLKDLEQALHVIWPVYQFDKILRNK